MIKKWFEEFRKKSLISKLSDLLFVALIVAMVIPVSRRELMTVTSKVRMLFVGVSESDKPRQLTPEDNFVFENSNGQVLQLTTFQDRPIILNFWATWCPPCRAEMPSLQKLYKDYGDKVHFLLVTSESFDKIAPFIAKYNYSLPIYQLSQMPKGVLSFQVLPTTFIIDKQGHVITREEGAADWDSKKVRALLDRLLQ